MMGERKDDMNDGGEEGDNENEATMKWIKLCIERLM